MALSTPGNLIASGQLGRNADVHVWDFHSRKLIHSFEEHDHGIESLAFSDDERVLASVGAPEDGKLLLWDLSNGCIIAANTKLPLGTSCVAFGGFVKDIKRRNTEAYMIVTAGKDGLMVWNFNPYNGDLVPTKYVGDVRATITRYITAVSFSSDFEYIYGATTSGDYVVASVKQQKIMQAIQATKMGVTAIISNDKVVIVGCGDATIKMFDTSAEFLGQVEVDAPVASLSFSRDHVEVLASTKGGTIIRMNVSTMKFILISESHTNKVVAVAFPFNENDKFATASTDGTIRVWETVDYSALAVAVARRDQERGAWPVCLAFSDCLFSGWSDGLVLCHNAETGQILWFIENAHPGGVTALCLSHNRRFILTGGNEGDLRLWELRSRSMISHMKEHVNRVNDIKLSEDDTRAVTCSRDRCILQWDLKHEKRTFCQMQRMGGINSIVLSKDESHVLSVGQEKKLVYWAAAKDAPVFQMFLQEETDEGRAVAISASGKYVCTGGTAGVVRLWDFASGRMLAAAEGHSGTINSLTFSPDERQVVSTADDGCIFVWVLFDESPESQK